MEDEQHRNPTGKSWGLFNILAFAFGVWALSKLGAPVNDPNSPDDPEYCTENNSRIGQNRSSQPMRIVVDGIPPPEPINDQQRTKEARTERRKQLRFHLEWIAALIALLLFSATAYQGCQMKKAVEATKEQTMHSIAVQDRPWIWVRTPESIQVEAGKPVSTKVCVFNPGQAPALVRARMRLEISPRAIEAFRRDAKENPYTTMRVEDAKGILKVILYSHDSYCDFPIESSQEVMTPQRVSEIMNGIASNSLDVAVYGRLYYSSPGNVMREHDDIFCFYLLKNGQVSACTNQPGAYTNWIQANVP